MKPFIHNDFLLSSETAKTLYHNAAASLPIIDFHNHLSPAAIYEDRSYNDLTEVWLNGDHYKWRAMRANGIPERLITGDGCPYEKFLAWADTVQKCIGNPFYHSTQLELKRYFGIDETLSPSTAEKIWNTCREQLQSPDHSVRNLLRMQQVEVLCTTDDPADDLKYHSLLAEDSSLGFSVLPTFRPGRILDIEAPGFAEYAFRLGDIAGTDISTLEGLLHALEKRLDFFISKGCRVTDHSLETDFFVTGTSFEKADLIYQKALRSSSLTKTEAAAYRGLLLTKLARLYTDHSLVMQLHIGALRNTSTKLYENLGADIGCDSINDFNYAPQLSGLLDSMDRTDSLPRTILYYLNPKDAPMLAAMAGNFQSNEEGIRGKLQLGSAWWFCDHKRGMEYQLDTLADTGLISAFVGMLTDSRSFLSFPRHEYFRRILCNKIGSWVDAGEYPKDMDYLNNMIRGICHDNAQHYFHL